MTGPVPQPAQPDPRATSWITNVEKKQETGKHVYTYTIKIGGGAAAGTPERTITVNFEEKLLSPDALAVRELGHIVLLKQMHELSKRSADPDLFKVGRKIQLVTDNPDVSQSTQTSLAFKKMEGDADTVPDRFFVADDDAATKQEAPQSHAILERPTKKQHATASSFIERCEHIRKWALSQFHHREGEPEDYNALAARPPRRDLPPEPVIGDVRLPDADADADGDAPVRRPQDLPPEPVRGEPQPRAVPPVVLGEGDDDTAHPARVAEQAPQPAPRARPPQFFSPEQVERARQEAERRKRETTQGRPLLVRPPAERPAETGPRRPLTRGPGQPAPDHPAAPRVADRPGAQPPPTQPPQRIVRLESDTEGVDEHQ